MEFRGSEKVSPEPEYADAGLIGRPANTGKKQYHFDCVECGKGVEKIRFFCMTNKPGGADTPDEVNSFCRREDIIGIGWGTPGDAEIGNQDDYLKHRLENESPSGRVKTPLKDFIIWMNEGDVVFVYDQKVSKYYKVVVESDWIFTPNAELPPEKQAEYEKYDIASFRVANWEQVERQALPGDVLSGTPPPNSTIHKKNFTDKDAEYLVQLRGDLHIDEEVDISQLKQTLYGTAFGNGHNPKSVITPLSSEELETIVVSYVQRLTGAVLLQHTRIEDLADIESILRTVDRKNGGSRTIATQVKRGGVGDEPMESVLEEVDDLYLYSTTGSTVSCAINLKHEEIAEYICYNTGELPPSALWRLNNSLIE